MVSVIAEFKCAFFDFFEVELEFVVGYFIEYSFMKFVLFSLGEFIEIVVIVCIGVCVFLGGW